MQLVYILCGGLFGIAITCILLLPQLKKNNKFNIEIDKENEELLRNNKELKEKHLHLFADISRLTAQKDFLEDVFEWKDEVYAGVRINTEYYLYYPEDYVTYIYAKWIEN